MHKMTGPLQLLVAAEGARLYAYNSTQVRAFLPGGTVDTAFGGGLAVPLDGFENDSRINRFVLQDDGKLARRRRARFHSRTCCCCASAPMARPTLPFTVAATGACHSTCLPVRATWPRR
ncbi:MAG: hypothetical protein IPH43_01210 [Xanthomonadales bacterium]|nr:hypothetical protein [Xanthomonadales bacterium]